MVFVRRFLGKKFFYYGERERDLDLAAVVAAPDEASAEAAAAPYLDL